MLGFLPLICLAVPQEEIIISILFILKKKKKIYEFGCSWVLTAACVILVVVHGLFAPPRVGSISRSGIEPASTALEAS